MYIHAFIHNYVCMCVMYVYMSIHTQIYAHACLPTYMCCGCLIQLISQHWDVVMLKKATFVEKFITEEMQK